MIIYHSTRVLPYVYFCQHKTDKSFYIGMRYSNKVPSTQDFGKYYFTSNGYVRKNFNQFDYWIVAEFFNIASAYEFESQLIKETKNPFQINKTRIIKTKERRFKSILKYQLKIKG